ncbi:hypothetical protein CMK11_04525 [Candidatus Poribacteria bacterium]|nr:hypothetical protein [Candidatus Poribacteria bacterium]
MGDTRSRQALKDKVRQERRGAVGMKDPAEETTLEIVRDETPGQAEHFWDRKATRSAIAAWAGVALVFALSLLLAFIVGFAAMYVYEVIG